MSLRGHAPSLTMLPGPRPALNLEDGAVVSKEEFRGRPIPALELQPWAELHSRSDRTVPTFPSWVGGALTTSNLSFLVCKVGC